MGSALWTLLTGALVLAACGTADAQYQEDTMEQDELGLGDIDSLRVPAAGYAGNDVCRLCHEAAYQTWLATAHARAFVPMRSTAAMAMGEEAGIAVCCPDRSGKCLCCHGTAHDVPAEYRGPGFRIGEGVACEKCHGPGASHVDAMEDGVPDEGHLTVPDRDACLHCHAPKASHAALNRGPFDLGHAWEAISHPLSAERAEDQMEPAELGLWHLADAPAPAAAYVGSEVCGDCHDEAYESWLASAHAEATRVLRSEMGVLMGMAADRNVIGGSVKNATCLSCHATGHDAPAAYRASGFRMAEGVGCEKCHGPGAAHVRAIEEHEELPGLGLGEPPTDQSCMTCHRRKTSHARLETPRFSYPRAWDEIWHK